MRYASCNSLIPLSNSCGFRPTKWDWVNRCELRRSPRGSIRPCHHHLWCGTSETAPWCLQSTYTSSYYNKAYLKHSEVWIPMNRTFHHHMIKILIQKINSKRMHRTRSPNLLTSSSVRQQLLPQGVQHRIPRRFHLRRTVIFRWFHIPQHSRGLVVNSNEVRVSWETAFEVARSFLHYNIVSISMTLYKIKWI